MWLAVAPAQPAPVMCRGTDRKGRDCPFRREGIGYRLGGEVFVSVV